MIAQIFFDAIVARQPSTAMSRMSILQEIAELSNPTPRDYDPEDIAPDFEASDSDEEKDDDAGREHYLDVG